MRDEQLLELVKRYPILYNTNLAQYRDHTVRNNAWEEIAGEMDTPVEDVKNKWAKLRNCFTNALKRRRKKSGHSSLSSANRCPLLDIGNPQVCAKHPGPPQPSSSLLRQPCVCRRSSGPEGVLHYVCQDAVSTPELQKSGQAATNLVPWKFEKQMEFLLPHLEGRQTVTNLADINDEDSTQHSELHFSEESTLLPPPIIRSPSPGSSSSRASTARACTTLNFTPRRTKKIVILKFYEKWLM